MSRSLILLLLFVLVGPAMPVIAAEPQADQPAVIDVLDGSEWRLSSLPGRNLAQVQEQRRPTIAFAVGRISGRGLCNHLTAIYTLGEPGELRIGRVGGATLPCREVESLERHFIRQLEDVTGYRIDGDRLVLVTRRGREVTFEPIGAPRDEAGRSQGRIRRPGTDRPAVLESNIDPRNRDLEIAPIRMSLGCAVKGLSIHPYRSSVGPASVGGGGAGIPMNAWEVPRSPTRM